MQHGRVESAGATEFQQRTFGALADKSDDDSG